MDEQGPGRSRKLDLDTKVYCLADTIFSGGKKGCDHDYDQQAGEIHSEYGQWVCTRCGGILTVGVWT